jgi:FlaA1/EpsC-like NDP-sugar epimerase
VRVAALVKPSEPGMTRFVITMRQAVHLIETALNTMEGGEVFIPVLPACAMEDLAEAAFTYDGRMYTGLRPGGEKRHELLMSGEGASRAVDLTGVSIVLPHLATWREKSVWDHEPKATPVLHSSQFAEQLSLLETPRRPYDLHDRGRTAPHDVPGAGHISIKSLATTMRPLKCAAARSIHI